MSILPKIIYRFHAIFIDIPFFIEKDEFLLTFIHRSTDLRMVKNNLAKQE